MPTPRGWVMLSGWDATGFTAANFLINNPYTGRYYSDVNKGFFPGANFRPVYGLSNKGVGVVWSSTASGISSAHMRFDVSTVSSYSQAGRSSALSVRARR